MFDSIQSVVKYFDKLLVISTPPISDIAHFSLRLDERESFGIKIDGDRIRLSIMIPRNEYFKGSSMVYSKNFEVSEFGEYMLMERWMEKNKKLSDFCKSLLSVKSVILYKTYLENGLYHFSFLFNSSDTVEISNAFFDIMGKIQDVKLVYLGDSFSYSNLEANARKDTIIVQLESISPNESLRQEDNHRIHNWTRMMKMSYGTDQYEAVEFAADLPDKGRVSADLPIKNVTLGIPENEMLIYMAKCFEEEKIVTESQLYEQQNEKLYIYFTTNVIFRDGIVHAINKVIQKYPNWNLCILKLQDLQDFLIESRSMESAR